jgi:carboxypeptidase C (cathepsin A)
VQEKLFFVAKDKRMSEKPTEQTSDKKENADKAEKQEPSPITTHHELTIGEKTLQYEVTTGRLPLKNEKDETEAHVFFIAYSLVTDATGPAQEKRPLMFSFNGGPGSSSVWLHLGALGPKRAPLNPDGSLPPPPYALVPNEYTWLEHTDLVFIDPVGTGYSRAKDEETAKKFWSVQGDIESLGEFVRLYLTRYERWASPLYLVGESYGTTRGAGLTGYLVDKGIAFKGLLLVSTVLNFQTLIFAPGNDLPYALFLPTYAATAWYHKRLPADLQKRSLESLMREVETFAETDYTLALMQGDRLKETTRKKITRQLARYTGLSETYIERDDLRINIWRFCKELRRDEGLTVGRLDSRLTGQEGRHGSDAPDFDPSMATIRPPYTAAFNDYIRRELGYESDLTYEILSGLGSKWEWGKGNGYTDTATALRSALSKNPHMKVFVASGYYDLATPHFAAEYTFAHMGLHTNLRDNLQIAYYEAGHMMYIENGSMAKLTADVTAFLTAT